MGCSKLMCSPHDILAVSSCNYVQDDSSSSIVLHAVLVISDIEEILETKNIAIIRIE